MKKYILFLILFVGFTAVKSQTVGEKMVNFCKKNMGKTVDRGECWDLIAFALNDAKAKWNKYDVYGEVFNGLKEPLKPGDVIEFHNVRFDNPDGSWFTMGEHYAIVYKVIDGKKIEIVHQNHNNIRKVQTLEMDLNNITKGEIIFYRPF